MKHKKCSMNNNSDDDCVRCDDDACVLMAMMFRCHQFNDEIFSQPDRYQYRFEPNIN